MQFQKVGKNRIEKELYEKRLQVRVRCKNQDNFGNKKPAQTLKNNKQNNSKKQLSNPSFIRITEKMCMQP